MTNQPGPLRSSQPEPRFYRLTLAGLVLAGVITSTALISGSPPQVDGIRIFTGAYNLAFHQVLSVNADDHRPGQSIDPLYPALLSVALRTADADLQELLDGDTEAAAATHRRAKLVNLLAHVALIITTYLLSRAVLGRRWLTLVPVAIVSFSHPMLSYIDEYYTEPLASMLLAIHTLHLVSLARGRWTTVTSLLGAASLGLLTLVRSQFLLWLAILSVVAAVVVVVPRLRQHVRVWLLVVMIAIAWIPPTGWMLRNAPLTERFPNEISVGAGRVLAVRLEKSTMNAKEAAGSLVLWSGGTMGPALAERFLPTDYWVRVDRRQDGSFYRTVQAYEGRVYDGRSTSDRIARSRAMGIYVREPLRQAGMSALVLWRVSNPQGQFRVSPSARVDTVWRMSEDIVARGYLLAFALVVVRVVRRRDIVGIALVAPTLFMLGVLAFLSHGLPRYSVPLVPILAIAAALALRRRPTTDEAVAGAPADASQA